MYKVLLMTKFNIGLISILSILNWHIWSATGKANTVCYTPDCRALGDLYLQNMNKNASACTDFYDYVCHEWGNRNPKPEFADVWLVQNVMALREHKRLQKLLENKTPSTLTIESAKDLYKACIKLPSLAKSPPNTISSIVSKVGNWSIFNPKIMEISVKWSSIDDQYIKKTAESALFDLNLAFVNHKQKSPITTKIEQLESPYGVLNRFSPWEVLSVPKAHYRNFLCKLIESIAPGTVKPSQYEKDVNSVIAFREQLREIIRALPKKSVMELVSIEDLQEWYDNQQNLPDSAKIDWLKKIRALQDNSSNQTLVHVNKLYLSKLTALLRQTTEIVLVNHIHLYFLERHILFSPEAKAELDQSLTNDISITASFRNLMPRWQACIKYHDMPITLRKMYIAATFTDQDRTAVAQIIEETKQLLREQILDSKWLDKEAKLKSEDKVKRMTSAIGYSEWINSSFAIEYLSKTSMDPLVPTVYYSHPDNRLYITASYLQSPIFVPNIPSAVKYGATVFTLGHETYHSLHYQELEYGPNKEKFWSDEMRKQFMNRLQLLMTQYGNKKNQEIKKYNIKEMNKLPTANEDMADVMGAKLAYRGYKKVLDKSNGTCTVLPGFEDKSCDQLFFIAFANTFCGDLTQNGMKKWLLIGTHSLPRLRVNGVVSNMQEFGKAFGCGPTDPLMSAKRWDIWQD